MLFKFTRIFLLISFMGSSALSAHCQMPCGIYDDQMVYDKVDEYYLTMVKATGAMTDNKFQNVQEKNQFVRWVIAKEDQSDEIADILTTYFLQQKLKPDDEDSLDLVKSIHRLLFLLVAIKQNADLKIVKEFGKEWDHFKELFHPEVECRKVIGLEENGGKDVNTLPPHPEQIKTKIAPLMNREVPHTHGDQGQPHKH